MKGSIRIARVGGIDVRVHVTFGLVLLLGALDWGLFRGYGLEGALFGGLFAVLLFLCVTLHELGHSLVAMRRGARVRDITLLPIGGVARLEGELERPADELLMALAGPAVNVALAVILGALLLPLVVWDAAGGPDSLLGRFSELGPARLALELMVANVGLALFNLLPAFPMDGGRVLRSLLALRLDEVKATRIAWRVGQAMALLMAVAGILTGALNLTLISLFVFGGGGPEYLGVRVRSLMRKSPVTAALADGQVAISPATPLLRVVELARATGQKSYPVVDRGRVVGVLSEEDAAERSREDGGSVVAGDVMLTDYATVDAGSTLLDLHRAMESKGGTVATVVDRGRFLGLATAESLRGALSRAATATRA
jgi:Zn-dependent protease